LLTAAGINPQQMIMNLVNAVVQKVLVDSGLFDLLRQIPNPLAPPMIHVTMEYELRLRPGNLFWMIRHKGKNGYRCLTLKRTAHYDSAKPIQLQTTGGRVDMPVVPPIMKYVNIFPGESTIYTSGGDEEGPKDKGKKPAKKKKKKK
jgi:hypothetical protein